MAFQPMQVKNVFKSGGFLQKMTLGDRGRGSSQKVTSLMYIWTYQGVQCKHLEMLYNYKKYQIIIQFIIFSDHKSLKK